MTELSLETQGGLTDENQGKGKLVVVSGPSGVGKDTIIKYIVERTTFTKFAAYTTRTPRPGEINGIDYRFTSEEIFLKMLSERPFLDHIQVNGYYYGTPLSDFSRVIESNQRKVLHLAAKSALLLKKHIPLTTTIFVMPPTYDDLMSRLKNRGMTDEQISARMADDPNQYELAPLFDFCVVNHTDAHEYAARSIISFIKEPEIS